VAEDRPVYETLLDAFVYAPLGAALVLADELPRLADRGRERVEKRVAVARVVGKFAVAEARRRLETLGADRFGGPSRPSGDKPRERGLDGDVIAPAPALKTAPASREITHRKTERSGSEAGKTGAGGPATNLAGSELPIPAYDTLAASQVVERLTSLTASELEAVRRHESETRRRRTVLHRIAQLSAERNSTPA
jgi:hypothetical protein